MQAQLPHQPTATEQITMTSQAATTFTAVTAPTLKIDAALYPEGRVSANGKLERRIVANLLAFMATKGWNVFNVWDSEENTPVITAIDVMELVFNLDEVWLDFTNATGQQHRVTLVLGNGIDIIADWSFSVGDPDGFHAAMDEFDPEDYA